MFQVVWEVSSFSFPDFRLTRKFVIQFKSEMPYGLAGEASFLIQLYLFKNLPLEETFSYFVCILVIN
jgi:hypothetical protein